MPGRIVFSRTSLRTIVPIAMVIPVLLVVTAIGLIVRSNAYAAAADLERQIFDQASQRIEQRLLEFVELPAQINLLNAHLIRSRRLDPNDLESWRETLYHQLHSFTTVSSIGFASTDKSTTWLVRYPDELTYEWGLLNAGTNGQMVEYRIDQNTGQILSDTRTAYDYDPHVRPWYIAAMQNPDRQVWSEIYPWVGGATEIPELGLGLVLTVRDSSNRIVGVHDTELSMTQISTFLADLRLSESGTIYIVDRDLGMVAASTLAPLVRSPDIRKTAFEIDDDRASAIASYVLQNQTDLRGPRDVTIDAQDERLRVRILPFNHRSGLDWSVWITLPESELLARTHQSRSQMIQAGAAATILVLALGIGLAILAVRPLTQLVEQIRDIGRGNFDARSDIHFTTELGMLSSSLNEVASDLKDRIRLKQSVELAMQLQQSLLPKSAPVVDGLDVHAYSSFCDETGGDYYDFLNVFGLPDTSLAVAVGDVSGHGVAAALMMTTARGALRSRASSSASLSELLTHTNSMLFADTKGESFMTMILLVIDAENKTLRWASAGQTPPLVYLPDTDRFEPLSSGSLPLGVMPDTVYDEHSLNTLTPGSILLVCTDGLWESQNTAGEPFTIERVQQIIRSASRLSAADIATRLVRDLSAHLGSSEPDDDITFVVVKLA